jgi:flagellar basal body-associated protein FliL
MKKIILSAAILAAAMGILYFFVLRPQPEPSPITFAPGDHFVTNVKDSNRLLKTAVVLVIDSGGAYKKLPLKLEEHVSAVRDTILFILRELSEEEIRASGVEGELREKIRRSINDKLETDGVRDVLFSDFVMQ